MTRASRNCILAVRQGLTLIELVVVMAILVALAGILLPIVPGMVGRAETSSRATNDGEIFKWIQMYEATTTAYPYDFDSLIDKTGGTIEPYVGGSTGATPPLALATLDANQWGALTSAGIVSAQYMATSANTGLALTGNGSFSVFSNTFNPYPSEDRSADRFTFPTGASAAGSLVTLTALGQQQLNLVDNATITTTNNTIVGGSPLGTTVNGSGVYVVFGLGRRCSIIGFGSTAPGVNFFDNDKLDPSVNSTTSGYARYGVVFQVCGQTIVPPTPVITGGTVYDFQRAKIVKVFRFGGTLTTGDDAIQSYWNDVSGVSGS